MVQRDAAALELELAERVRGGEYLRAGKVPGAKSIEDVRRAYVNQVPMKRGCSYDDVCNAVVFLASDQSCYITGISLSVTGGQEMN